MNPPINAMRPYFSEDFWIERMLYQDDDLIVLNKPSGIFTHRSHQSTEHYTVLVAMRQLLGCYVYPLHRLDRATSGILALGLSSDAARVFSSLFAERRITKRYWAIVRGWSPDRGRVERPLKKLDRDVFQEAETSFCTLGRAEIPVAHGRFPTVRFSLLEVSPKTGRQHQIRRHLRGIDHPIINDSMHGDTRINRCAHEHLGVKRLLLHSTDLGFTDPRDGKWRAFQAPVDPDLISVCERFSWPTSSAPLASVSSKQT